jgi:hypothetical protein
MELLKILGAFVGAVFGALGAVSFKEYLDRRRLRDSEQHKRWLPLLRAAQNLREKLDEFIAIYRQPTSQWRNYEYDGRPLPLEARDFHELYLLDIDAALIETFLDLRIDPGERRKNPEAVRSVRARIHELNRATILLYRMAAYFGYAQRVRKELLYGKLEGRAATQVQFVRLLDNVKRELNGPTGAGMIDDLQDLIGENVWSAEDSVIGYQEFRERILSPQGWEEFTELFRFFVHFHKKLDYEVKQTEMALGQLCNALETNLRRIGTTRKDIGVGDGRARGTLLPSDEV